MDAVYKGMFIVGVLYTFISLILNGVSGVFHLGGNADGWGGHGHIDGAHGHAGGDFGSCCGGTEGHGGHGDFAGNGPMGTFLSYFSILLNPLVAVSFLTVFGGMGIMGTEHFQWNAMLVLLVALSMGIVTAFLLYRFVSIPLYRSENSSDVSREELQGTLADVSSAILEDGFGKISYTAKSIKFTAPAKHIDGKAVQQGQRVVICKIENNIFYVSEVQEL